jgi:hypothetical protein
MPRSTNGRWPHLPLERLSDKELLMIFETSADDDGGASAVQVAEHTDEGVKAARSIGIRFAWLKRWGYMEQERDKRWFLTPEGEQLLTGTDLTHTQLNSLNRVAVRAIGLGDALGGLMTPSDRKMLRRQLRYREVNG